MDTAWELTPVGSCGCNSAAALPRVRFRPLEDFSTTITVTIPAVGGTVTARALRLPGMGLSETPTNAMGPELTIAVAVVPQVATDFAAPPGCVLFQRLWVVPAQAEASRSQLTQTAADAPAWLFRFPVPPECTIEADVTGAATTTGNPALVDVHLRAYVLATDDTEARAESVAARPSL